MRPAIFSAGLLALFLVAFPCFAQNLSGERITDFSSTIHIAADSSMDVQESISVVAQGLQIKHGIYRDFPTQYHDKEGNSIEVGFNVVTATRDGQPVSYHVSEIGNGERVYLGAVSDKLPPGPHQYILQYRTDHQLGYFKDVDELYWNVTGNGWVFPIEHVTTNIFLPPGAKILQQAGYTGLAGAQGHDYSVQQSVDGNFVSFTATRPLNPTEGLTVAVGWPKGFVTPPPVTTLHRPNHATMQKIGYGSYLLLLMYYVFVWFKFGRGPRKGTIIPLFTPPQDKSPGEIGHLQRTKLGGSDNTAFSASLVNMAVSGYLKIEQYNGGFFSKKGFLLQKAATVPAALATEEQVIANQLIETYQTFKLDTANAQITAQAFQNYQGVLAAKDDCVYYNNNLRYLALGTALSFGVGFALLSVMKLGAVIGLLFVTHALFAKLLKAPTVEGRKLLDQLEGFKMYLSTAEKERLNMFTPPEMTPAIFEKCLPYAIALGVQNKWGKRFEATIANGQFTDYQPTWYTGTAWDIANVAAFTSLLGEDFSSAVASAATPPGSSMGSDGGGSSGGGGGGGGGGGF